MSLLCLCIYVLQPLVNILFCCYQVIQYYYCTFNVASIHNWVDNLSPGWSFCLGLYIYSHLELKRLVFLIFRGSSARLACLRPTCAAPVSRQNQLASSWWTAKPDFFDLVEMKGEIILDFASFENRQTHVSFNVKNRRLVKSVGCRYAAP